MKTFIQYLEGDYCQGLSLNADFFWEPGSDNSFLTTGNSKYLIDTLHKSAEAAKMKVVDSRLTKYGNDPEYGFTYLVVLGQSHIIVHTWPEKYTMNVDVFTCGNEGNPKLALQLLQSSLKPHHVKMKQMERGIRKDIENADEKPDSPDSIRKPSNHSSLGGNLGGGNS